VTIRHAYLNDAKIRYLCKIHILVEIANLEILKLKSFLPLRKNAKAFTPWRVYHVREDG